MHGEREEWKTKATNLGSHHLMKLIRFGVLLSLSWGLLFDDIFWRRWLCYCAVEMLLLQAYQCIIAGDSSFADVIDALVERSKTRKTNLAEEHYMPQTHTKDDCTDYSHLLPIESVEEAFEVVHIKTGVYFNVSGFTSPHYIKKQKADMTQTLVDNSHRNFSFEVRPGTRSVTMPPYPTFLRNKRVNAKVCKLFCNDLRLYALMCASPFLKDAPMTQEICKANQQRVLETCGSNFNFCSAI